METGHPPHGTASEAEDESGQVGSDDTRRPSAEAEVVDKEKTAPNGTEGAGTGAGVTPTDPNLVGWDGPDDPANPRNWSKSRKMTNVVLVSLSVLYANLATTMFAPGSLTLAHEFRVENSTVIALTVTIPSLGFSLGPFVFAPLSEILGRVPIYRASSIIYLAFTIGCSRSTNVGEFLAFRFLCGCAAASFMTCGGGTIADLLPKEERGLATALFTAGPLLGPVIGPVIGGFVTQALGWRWTFYLVLILAGTISTAAFIMMKETNAVMLLAAKAARLRKETGNQELRAFNDKRLPVRQLVTRALVRPPKMLIFSPMVLFTSLYMALVFGMVYLLFATFPMVFQTTYHWSVGISGLAYLGVGVGSIIGLQMFARLSDRLLRPKDGDKVTGPERRLILMIWVGPSVPIGIFLYGWTSYYKVHWIVPIIGTAFIGLGSLVVTSSSQVYVIDMFGPEGAASALAAITLVRNASGAFLALAAPALYQRFGLGWGNSVLGFIALAFTPVPLIFYKYGEWLRNKFPVEL